MKVPPKRKGNARLLVTQRAAVNEALNESPSEKEGKCREAERTMGEVFGPSMKVPPKRKGNSSFRVCGLSDFSALNESPSEKEGKCQPRCSGVRQTS